MLLRLSAEDLAKTWSAWLFFCFAWTSGIRHMEVHSRHAVAPRQVRDPAADDVVR